MFFLQKKKNEAYFYCGLKYFRVNALIQTISGALLESYEPAKVNRTMFQAHN